VAPLPTGYDTASDFQIRSAWAEADEVFQRPLWRPLRFRAGRQYVYGTAIAHIDGLTIGWAKRGLELHAYAGRRVPDWNADRADVITNDGYSGFDLRADLGLWWSIPIVLTASSLSYGAHEHSDVTAAYARPEKDVVIRASARQLDGEWVRERATARLQISDITQITVDVDHRSRDDWRWDAELVDDDDAATGPRYLSLGPVTPRLLGSVRAGTVLLDNVDVLVRGAASADLSGDNTPVGAYTAGWLEGGGAIELRLRRAIAVGVSGLYREYDRPGLEDETVTDMESPAPSTCPDLDQCPAQPFPQPERNLGETALTQGSIHIRYTTGARRFSAGAEIYGRRTTFSRVYVDDDPDPETDDQRDDAARDWDDRRGGGRFTLEAWPTARMRILAEYDVSSIIEVAPEIRGYKSLRMLVEATW
jgi:hypothetical protein